MEVVIMPDATAASAYVAEVIADTVDAGPGSVLGLATGSSPLGIYAELVRRRRAGTLSFRETRVFLLDEYIGLPPGHPQSYRTFIDTHFARLVDIAPERVHVPGAGAIDAELVAACDAYERDIRAAGGIDVQLLGIGADGHLGFNEPTSSLGSRTRVKTLTDETRRDNARFFDGIADVPRHVVTQGIATILDAARLILIATGEAKARPIARAVEGPLTSMCPASALQLHPHATVVIDEAAATALTLADYFRTTFANKPRWQRR